MRGRSVVIYGLTDKSVVFCVGKTTRRPKARVDEHYYRCGWEGTPTARYIRAMKARGEKPGIVVLEIVTAEHADEREEWHIADHTARSGPHKL